MLSVRYPEINFPTWAHMGCAIKARECFPTMTIPGLETQILPNLKPLQQLCALEPTQNDT